MVKKLSYSIELTLTKAYAWPMVCVIYNNLT